MNVVINYYYSSFLNVLFCLVSQETLRVIWGSGGCKCERASPCHWLQMKFINVEHHHCSVIWVTDWLSVLIQRRNLSLENYQYQSLAGMVSSSPGQQPMGPMRTLSFRCRSLTIPKKAGISQSQADCALSTLQASRPTHLITSHFRVWFKATGPNLFLLKPWQVSLRVAHPVSGCLSFSQGCEPGLLQPLGKACSLAGLCMGCTELTGAWLNISGTGMSHEQTFQ